MRKLYFYVKTRYFYVKTKISVDFQICIGVPLNEVFVIQFLNLTGIFGVSEIDLFASRISFSIRKTVPYTPDHDLFAKDTFSVTWTKLKFYLFPQFCIIGRFFAKTRK